MIKRCAISALLIIHGAVCLLGAFFPFYPPVYLFCWFFPGHFAIKLTIVLLIGASQVIYGLYLSLKIKWHIKWYWPACVTIVLAGLLLVYPVVQSPELLGAVTKKDIHQPIPYEEMLPVQAKEAADDIMPTPGGPGYRANLHQAGVKNPWEPVEISEAYLGSREKETHVYYRSYIETAAGEARNNIIMATIEGKEIKNLSLYADNIPYGITLTDGMQWSAPYFRASVLVVETAADIIPGEYDLDIGLLINGRDYGTITCTIDVIAGKITSQEIPRLQKAKQYHIVGEANLANEDPDRTAGLWLIISEDASGFEEYAQTAAQAVLDLYHRYGRDYTSVSLVPSADIRISYAHATFASDGRGPAGMTGSAPAKAFYWKVRAADRDLNEQEKAIASLWAARQQDFPQKNLYSSLSYDEDALRQYIAETLNIPYDEVQMPELEMQVYDLPQQFIDKTVSMAYRPSPGGHGITSTRVEQGSSGIASHALMIHLTLEDLAKRADAVLIGKVVDILPSREVADWEFMDHHTIVTDVVIEVEQYLYDGSGSKYVTVAVLGGQIGEMRIWAEDQPVFDLGEEVLIFLSDSEEEWKIPSPEECVSGDFYMVTGSRQGKLGYRDGQVITPEGNSITISELEKKIAQVHEE